MIQELLMLGLTENESKVYLALLDIGLTTTGKIIKKANLHRTLVYDNLDRLIKKGLVSYIIIKGRKYFETTEPYELKQYLDKQKKEIAKREQVLNDILPEIQERRALITKPAEAAIFRGKQGLKTVFDKLVSKEYELLIFATGWGMKKTMGPYFNQWHIKLRENKVKGRAVVSRKMKKAVELDKFPYKIRYLSTKFVLPSTILVQGDKVVTVVWQNEPLIILVNSKESAKSYKTYFELLWKMAKK